MRISEAIEMFKDAQKLVGDCQVFFSFENRDDLVIDVMELTESDYSEDDDCIVVPITPDVM
jgi:hypothetical protein